MADDRTRIARLTRGVGLWLLLLLSLPVVAGSDSPLGPWRQKLAETRLLAENDFPRADAEASNLQNSMPSDATPADRAALFNLLARIDLYLGRTEQAAGHIRLAFDLAKGHGDKIGQAEADLNLALNAINQARIDDMNQAVMDAMTVLEGVEGRPDLLAETMLRASMMYRRMEQLGDSVAVAVQAMDIAKRSGNALALAYANQAMAAAYDVNHRDAEALGYYRNMRERAVAAGSKRLEAEALIGIGGMENNLGNNENGDEAIRQATETFRALRAPFYLAHALVRSAEGLRIRGRLADTIGLLNEAESLHRQGNNKIGLWWVLYIRYGNYLTLGETAKAQADAERGYRLAKEIGFPLYLSKSAKSLADVAAAGGDHERAYQLLFEADEMAAKAAAEKASSRMVDLANHYQNEIKQRQIEELNQRNRLQQAEIGQRALQQRWLWTVLAASFLLLAATLFFVARLRRSHRRLRTLNKQMVETGNQLRATLDAIPDLMFEVDLDGRYYDCHAPQPELLAAPRETLLGKTVAEVMPAEAAAVFSEALREAQQHGLSFGKQLMLPLSQGDGWFELSVAAKPVVSGETPRFIVMSRDISERQQAERRLHEREQAIRAVVDNSPDYIARYDARFRRTYVNPALQKLFGLPLDQILGKTPADSTPIQQDMMAMLEAVFEHAHEAQEELSFRNEDGSTGWADIRMVPEFGPDGGVVAVLSIGRDITERKHAENALKESEQRYREIFENVSDSLYLVEVTPDERFINLAFNKAFEQSTGATRDMLIGRDVGCTLEEGNAMEREVARIMLARYRRCIEAGTAIEENTVFDLPSGRRTYYSTLVPLRDESGRICRILGLARDVTELKRAEREFRTLAENIPDHIIRYDAQARKTFMNTAMARLMGVDPCALLGLTPENTPTETRAMKIDVFSEKLRQVLETGEARELEVTLQHATEGRQIHNIKFVAERDEQGHIVGALAIGHDITALKAAENALRERERRYREIFENVTDSLFLVEVTPEGRFRNLAVNFAFEQTMGIPREDLIGIDVGGVASEEGETEVSHGVVAKYRRCLKAGSNIEEETILDLPAGRRHFHSTLVPLYDESGRICRILGIAHDISERKRAEERIQALNVSLEQQVLDRTAELRQQTRYLRTLVDSLPLLVWLKDTESRFVMVNQATADAYCLSIEQMIGKSDLDLWPRETAETYIAEDREVMLTRRRSVVEKLLTLNQSAVWTEIDKLPVLDEDNSVLGTVGVARNISERKALEMAREKALAEAVRLSNLRSEFMARMSHELRTPLNGILGYAQVLQRETGIGERQSGMLNVIQESGEYLLHLINDILDFAKIEAGKQTLALSDVPLRRFLRNLAGIVSIRAEQKQLAFRCEIDASAPDLIRADEIRLRQVLLNLLSNAVKFTDRGRIELKVGPASAFRAAGIDSGADAAASTSGRLRFQIRDSGVGIEAGQLENIFQPFEQTGNSRQGTGLGLAISRELVRLMGGEIRVDSRVGEGSVFWFDLDVDVVPGFGDGMEGERGEYRSDATRVLVVSAGDENRKLLSELLSRLGFDILSAVSGAECLESVQNRMPDLVVLIEDLPDMIGIEILRVLRGLFDSAGTPIIVFGGKTTPAEMAAAGASAFLALPIDGERLAATVTELFRHRGGAGAEPLPDEQRALRQTVDLPPPEEMQMLYRFAREGSMRDIIRHADHLTELDERYRPFAGQLHALASAYQSKAILALVSRYIDNHSLVP